MADPTFTESTLPTAAGPTDRVPERRTLGDIYRPTIGPPPLSPSMASESGAHAAGTPHGNPIEERTRQATPVLSPDTMRLIRQTAVEAVGELVDKTVDAKLTSLREELLSQVKSMMIQQTRDVNTTSGALGTDPPLRTQESRSAFQDASVIPTRIDDPAHRELRQTRLDLLLERRRSDALHERLKALSEQEYDNRSHRREAADQPFMTGTPNRPVDGETPALPSAQRGNNRNPRSSSLGVRSIPSLGPPHYGLTEITPADPDFRPVVSYRRYRLSNVNADTGSSVSRYVGDYVKLFKPTMDSRKFDGSIPIAVLDFLSSFKRICDEHGVTEGLAVLLLPHFLAGDARALVEENFEISDFNFGGYSTWPEAVQLLLLNYAKDRHIKSATRDFNNCTMRENEDEATYGRRLQRIARLCGGVIDVQKLVTRFCDGLPDYIQPSIMRILPTLPEFNRYQACVDEATTIGTAQRAVMNKSSQRQKTTRGDNARTTRVNQVAFQPAPHLLGRTTLPAPSSPMDPAAVLQVGTYDGHATSDSEGSFHTAAATLSSPFHNVDQDSTTNIQATDPAPVDAIYAGRRSQQRYDREYQRDQPSDICYHCYQMGHRAPNCPDAGRPTHDPHFQRRLYENYIKLTIPQRDHLRSVGRAPIILDLSAIQQPLGSTSAKSSATQSTAAPQPTTRPQSNPTPATTVPKN